MLRRMILCALLAGCAAAPPPLVAPPLGVALTCHAEQALACPRFGCTAGQPGLSHTAPLSLEIPGQGELGRLCAGENCQNARYRPTLTRALGWTANVSTGVNWTRPMGEVEISSNRDAFQLRQENGVSLSVWNGVCAPAGS